jgi:fructokinase
VGSESPGLNVTRTILCFGELLWDLLPGGAELGGAPSNFAFRMSALGHDAALVTRVGQEDLGNRALELLRAKGVDTRFVQRDCELPTGTVNVLVDERGEPDFHIVPNVAYDCIEMTAELATLASQASCVCFGTLVQRSQKSRETLYQILDFAKAAVKVLDINLRKRCYSEETVRESLKRADILKLNESEVFELGRMLRLPSAIPEFAKAITHEYALRYCIVTLGADGLHAFAQPEHGEWTECQLPGHRVAVQDTCGSGDGFTAGFIHKLLTGAPLTECCAYGNALGALVAATKGGMTAVPVSAIEALAARGN